MASAASSLGDLSDCHGFRQGVLLMRLAATRQWLNEVVVAERLCPFVATLRDTPKLRLRASEASNADDLLREVAEEAHLLSEGLRFPSSTGPETTLLVLDDQRPDVAKWPDLVRLSWRLQSEVINDGGMVDEIQLVFFHPLAVHSTYAEGLPDAADFSIRSPYPTIHLLRQADVLKGVQSYPDASLIPARNKERLRALGLEVCAARLEACTRPVDQRS